MTSDAAQAAVATITVDRSLLATYVEQLHHLVDEAKLQFEAQGLRSGLMDPANVAMVHASLDADACSTYESPGVTVGMNLGRLADVLAVVDSEGSDAVADVVSITVDEDAMTMDVTIGADTISLACIDPHSVRNESDLPDVDLAAEVTITSEHFEQIVTNADVVGDTVAFGYDASIDEFVAEAEGATDDYEHRVVGNAEAAGDAWSLFQLDYVKPLAAAIPEGTDVTLELGEEHPMFVRYDVGDGAGSVAYSIAPQLVEGS